MKKLKIFVGPVEIAGYYFALSQGFKELGLNCDYIIYQNHNFNYANNINYPFLIRLSQYYRNKKLKQSNFLFKLYFALLGELFSSIWAVYAIFKYDVFVFGFGMSLLRFNIDLYILKLLNKTVISNLAHGSECRPSYLNGANKTDNLSKRMFAKKLLKEAIISKELTNRHEKLATYIIGYPLTTYYFSKKKFINLFNIGLPYSGSNVKNIKTPSVLRLSKKKYKILHAPSSQYGKGTNIIKDAIQNLKNKGYDIDFILMSNMDNSKVINEIIKCDFVVDQVFSDHPLPGLATEAAFYGKPTIIGGYGFKYLQTIIPKNLWPPSETCNPYDIERVIESFIVNQNERNLLGRRAQNFVKRNWSSLEVAKKYIKIIEGNIPDSWWLNPNKILYFEGYGQTKEETNKTIKNLTNTYGMSSLNLDHNKNLKNALVNYYNLND